jgi:hypothetical protein
MITKTDIIGELSKLKTSQLITLLGMVEYCLDNEKRLGMDGGYHEDNTPTAERRTLENLVEKCLK